MLKYLISIGLYVVALGLVGCEADPDNGRGPVSQPNAGTAGQDVAPAQSAGDNRSSGGQTTPAGAAVNELNAGDMTSMNAETGGEGGDPALVTGGRMIAGSNVHVGGTVAGVATSSAGIMTALAGEVSGTIAGGHGASGGISVEIGGEISLIVGGRPQQGGQTPCVPRSCEVLDAECGEFDDGCGGRLVCGPCAQDAFCDDSLSCSFFQCPPLQVRGDDNRCVDRLDPCLELRDRGLTTHPPAGVRWSFQLTNCQGEPVSALRPLELSMTNGDIPGTGVSTPSAPQPYETFVLLSIDLSSSVYRRGAQHALLDAATDFIAEMQRGTTESRMPHIAIQTYGRGAQTSVIEGFTQDYERLERALDGLRGDEVGLGIANAYGAYRDALSALQDAGTTPAAERILFVLAGGPHEAGDFENQRQLALEAKMSAHENDTTIMAMLLTDDASLTDGEEIEALADESPDGFRLVEVGRPLLASQTAFGFARRTHRIGASVVTVGVCTPLELGMGVLTATVTREGIDPVTLSSAYPTNSVGLNGDVRPESCMPEAVASPCENRECGDGAIVGFQCGGCGVGTSCAGTENGGTRCLAVCGDMAIGPGEVCDGAMGCAPDCKSLCGDFITEGTEVCDGQASCAADCASLCGDGVIGPGEVCDGEDGCGEDCRTRCGDGIREPGEQCDDGDRVDGNECTNACTLAVCGDGVVEEGVEECDDGDTDNSDECTNACKDAECGDGIEQVGVEECDDGNENSKDECTADCRLPVCGDGILQEGAGEACDDGNRIDGDECTNACTIARCGDGSVQVGLEACDDGNLIATDTCTDTCEDARCGDGIHHIGVEECDDGDGSSEDGCDSNCLVPRPNMDFVKLVGGLYPMGVADGNADEMPRHEVRVRDFYFSRQEVTVAQYRACVRAGACDEPGMGDFNTWRPMRSPAWDNKPINYVSWHNAHQYAAWLGARLPTEAEWEYAATSSGQNGYTYPWGEDAPSCELARYLGCDGGIADVGEHPSGQSVHGLDDLAGNVAEWIEDEYFPTYVGAPVDGSARTSPDGLRARVVRGGSFTFDAMNLRSTDRDNFPPGSRLRHVGIRLACFEVDRDGHCKQASH